MPRANRYYRPQDFIVDELERERAKKKKYKRLYRQWFSFQSVCEKSAPTIIILLLPILFVLLFVYLMLSILFPTPNARSFR